MRKPFIALALVVLTGLFASTANAVTPSGAPLSAVAPSYSPIERVGCTCGPYRCVCVHRRANCVWRAGYRYCRW
jgi:hypothetical protein